MTEPELSAEPGSARGQTSGLEPLTCSLRVRFRPPYLSRKVTYLEGKVSVAYRRVTPNYAQVSVRHLPRGSNPRPSEPQPYSGVQRY
jgi:hypothetical protein